MVHLDPLTFQGVLSHPLGLHPSTPCALCACAYAYTHTFTYKHSHPRQNIREDTDNTPISPSVKNKHPRQATSALHRLAQPPHPRHPTLMNKLRPHKRVRKCVRWCGKHLCNVHTCICTGISDTCFSARHTHCKKYIWTRTCAPMQRCSNFFAIETIANYLESYTSILQAVVHRTPTCCLNAISCLTTARSWKQSKSTLGELRVMTQSPLRCRISRSVVAQASSDHPRWCGPHPAGLCHARICTHAWPQSSSISKFCFRHFSRAF